MSKKSIFSWASSRVRFDAKVWEKLLVLRRCWDIKKFICREVVKLCGLSLWNKSNLKFRNCDWGEKSLHFIKKCQWIILIIFTKRLWAPFLLIYILIQYSFMTDYATSWSQKWNWKINFSIKGKAVKSSNQLSLIAAAMMDCSHPRNFKTVVHASFSLCNWIAGFQRENWLCQYWISIRHFHHKKKQQNISHGHVLRYKLINIVSTQRDHKKILDDHHKPFQRFRTRSFGKSKSIYYTFFHWIH